MGPRIVCPFVLTEDIPRNRLSLQPATADFVQRHGGELVNVSGSDYAYWELMRRLWKEKQPFLIIEQDIVPTEAAFASLLRCNHLWCGCPYDIGGQQAACLGFTRFSRALIRAVPDLLDRVPGLAMGDIRPHAWFRLDVSVAQVLIQQEGRKMHVHNRHPVKHLKSYR